MHIRLYLSPSSFRFSLVFCYFNFLIPRRFFVRQSFSHFLTLSLTLFYFLSPHLQTLAQYILTLDSPYNIILHLLY